MLDRYLAQVRLLLTVLPEIARETAFALKGGTAINLFYRDLPRLSVDLDLTSGRVGFGLGQGRFQRNHRVKCEED